MRTTIQRLLKPILITLCCASLITAQSIQPEGPRLYLDTALPVASGRTFNATTAAQVQAAINTSLPGDKIVVQPGYLIARFDFKNTANLPGWTTLISANADRLPPYGGLVTPDDIPNMVTVESPDTAQVLDFWPTYQPANVTKAHHWLVIGFNIVPSRNYPTNGGLVKMGTTNWQTSLAQQPSDLWLDRCVIRGYPDKELIRGVILNGARQSVTGCWITEAHSINKDAQAICGWNGSGPYRIVGNRLEASGENFMLGGDDAKIPGMVPADLEFRNNICSKPLAWNWLGQTYGGYRWAIKNNFELKNARRVVVSGNTFEGCWTDQEHGQVGFAIQITPRNQYGTNPWATVEDVQIIGNKIRHAGGGINILGSDDNHPSGRASRILIADNNFEDIGGPQWGGNGRLLQVLAGPVDVDFRHNTGEATHALLVLDLLPAALRFSYTDNIVTRGESGLIGSDTLEGADAFNHYTSGGSFLRNVILTTESVASRYPSGNYFTH